MNAWLRLPLVRFALNCAVAAATEPVVSISAVIVNRFTSDRSPPRPWRAVTADPERVPAAPDDGSRRSNSCSSAGPGPAGGGARGAGGPAGGGREGAGEGASEAAK